MRTSRGARAALGATALGAAIALTGCSGAPGSSGTGSAAGFDRNALSVVATTTQVADFTREVAGSAAAVTQLIQPNQSAHSYDPSAADLVALSKADVVVKNGAGLEEWLDDALDASGFSGVVIDASTGVAVDDDTAGEHTGEGAGDGSGDQGGDDDQGGDADDVTTPRPSDKGSGEAGSTNGDAHEHGENPHIWTDPKRAEQMVDTIADGLAAAYPSAADTIQDNAVAYTAKLAALDEWSRANIDTVPAAQRLFVSNHDAFGYFVEAYNIDYVGSVIPSFDDNAEPSAAEIDELVAAIKQTGTKAVFSEASLSPKTADTIAREAGVKVYSGDDALYGDSLGPAGGDGATYLSSQEHNVRQLLSSWGVTPTPLPASLQ